ncbi:hypothetical protein R0137_05250 [Congregibacter brevis]|uniref:PEP-CTERM protein-sorting domain-containing protein n=1 Tax=Congregibacter brevis TaxID=3081201 RepID=A0ABZ0IG14_9GAMM|nr:hypothetical protein R0137_05250 [Congregibacter sp. IMCC45268]
MKSYSYLLPASFVVCTSAALAGVPTLYNTETVQYRGNNYTIDNASVWSADGPGRIEGSWELTESQWDYLLGRPPRARLGVGAVLEQCIVGYCIKAGAAAGLELEAYVLPYAEYAVDPGTFDASVNYAPSVDYQSSGLGVDFFKLNTDSGFDADASSFLVKAPSLEFETGLNINTNLNLFAEACLLGCFLDETYNLASLDFQLPLVQIDTLDSKAKVFSPPTGIEDIPVLIESIVELVELAATDTGFSLSGAGESALEDILYDDISAVLAKVSEDQWTDYKDDLKSKGDSGDTSAQQKLDRIEEAEAFIEASPVSLDFSNPFTENAEGEWGGVGGDIGTAGFGGDLLKIDLDVDEVIGYALGLTTGGTLGLETIGITDSPINVEVELLDLQIGPRFDLQTDLTLSPELMVDLAFTAPVLIKGEIGKQTSYQGTWENIPEIALVFTDPSEGLGEVDFNEAVVATPTFSVEAKLSNHTYIDVAVGGALSGLSATVEIEGFSSLEIGPVINFPFESDSLAQIDIYKAAFETGQWTAPTGDDRKSGATRTTTEFNPATQQNVEKVVITPFEGLSFDPSGEIVFQARSKTTDNDVARGDARVQQFLNTNKLIAADLAMRGYDEKPFDTFSSVLSTERLFEFSDSTVKTEVENVFRINVGQHAQVMTDGQFKVSDGGDSFQTSGDKLNIERGGSLELGARNPYGGSTGANPNQATQGAYGFINQNVTQIEGDLYMNGDRLAGGDPDRYKFVNTGGATLRVGTQGRLKFDGKFENQSTNERGFVTNNGNIELTAADNVSTGIFRQFYGAELDLFGTLSIYEGTDSNSNSFRDLYNNGQVTLYSGALLDVRGGEKIARVEQASDFLNQGELAIHNGATFVLSNNDAGIVPKQNQSVDRAIFENLHIVDNQGVIRNESGQKIINGSVGTDWQAMRGMDDPLAYARQQRDAALGPLPDDYASATLLAEQAANQANIKRLDFTSKLMSFVNDAAASVEGTTRGVFDVWLDSLIKREQARSNNDTELLSVYSSQEELFNELTSSQANTFTTIYNDQFGSTVRSAESEYGVALRDRAAANAHERDIRRAIDAIVEQGTGPAVMMNGKDGLIVNRGEIVNHAVLVNSASGEIYNDTGGKLDNAGGYIQNNGLLVNQGGAELVNNVGGVIDNGMKVLRDLVGILGIAELVNLGELSNSGEIVNNDTLVNYGQIANGDSAGNGVLVNNGMAHNLGTVTNDATLSNLAGAQFNNHDTVVNNGLLVNDGVFNNGLDPYGQVGTNVVSIGRSTDVMRATGFNFYRYEQGIRESENVILALKELVRDSRARENLVGLEEVSTGNFLLDLFYTPFNQLLEDEYRKTLNAARSKTEALEGRLADAESQRFIDVTFRDSLNAVVRDKYIDTDGNTRYGEYGVDLANVVSYNTANLENNGTIENRGLLNNLATITNNEGGLIRNSGLLMVGQSGKINNAGHLLIEETQFERLGPSGETITESLPGTLVSNGTVDNSGLLEITSGTLINGTLENRVAVINNSGQIKLSGAVELVTDPSGVTSKTYKTASLINQATINNQSGGKLTIGSAAALVQDSLAYAMNTVANFGDLVNEDGASIENYGHLYNAGLVDNQAGSSFVNEGLLNNSAAGEVRFAESTTLGGQVINNGLITMGDSELLTLTGSIGGNGTFVGDTLLNQLVDPSLRPEDREVINPGNSPGLLTFDGNVIAMGVNWVMEIWGTERGSQFGYDAVDITGSFQLAGDMSLSIFSLLDFQSVTSQSFTFLSITGDLLDAAGFVIQSSFAFNSFAENLGDNWAGSWNRSGSGWGLVLDFIGDEAANQALVDQLPAISLARLQSEASDVPAPGTLFLFLSGLVAVRYRRVGSATASA